MPDIVAYPLMFDGVLDHLTDDQTAKLKAFWELLLNGTGETEPLRSPSDDKTKHTRSPQDQNALDGAREIIAKCGSEKFKDAYWSYIAQAYPDTMMLKFLRARQWDVYQAFLQFVECIAWRIDAKVEELLKKGEEGLKDDVTFRHPLEAGLVYIQGTDRAGRPVLYANVRLYKPFDSTASKIAGQDYVIYVVEAIRKFLMHPNEKFTLVFDMTGFGLVNMDWKIVTFLRQCFRDFYPECLNSVLIHNAPWVFWGIWKILSPLIDPVVRSKIQFSNTSEDLRVHIEESHLIPQLGGTSEFEWKYIPVFDGENERMKDEATKKALLSDRNALIAEYLRLTRLWIQNSNLESEVINLSRRTLDKALRSQYLILEPYIRTRGMYHRSMNILDDGRCVFIYGKASASEEDSHSGVNRVEVLGEASCKKKLDKDIEDAVARLNKDDVEAELRPRLPHLSSLTVNLSASTTSVADEMLERIQRK